MGRSCPGSLQAQHNVVGAFWRAMLNEWQRPEATSVPCFQGCLLSFNTVFKLLKAQCPCTIQVDAEGHLSKSIEPETGTSLLPFWQQGRKPPEQLQPRSPTADSPFSRRSSEHSNSSHHGQGELQLNRRPGSPHPACDLLFLGIAH